MTTTPPDAARAADLVAARFPELAGRTVAPVSPQGHDNRSFLVGCDLVARFPSAPRYAAQTLREARWLPYLAPHLPVSIPEVVALVPACDAFPHSWSLRRWISGAPPAPESGRDSGFAKALAEALRSLHSAPAPDGPDRGPPPGPDNFHRGGPLGIFADEARAALKRLGAPTATFEAAVEDADAVAPAWVHGDVAPANMLVEDGRLVALIDFGLLAWGDPACDLAIAWTFFEGEARRTYLEAADPCGRLTLRARGWAIWKAAITLAAGAHPAPGQRPAARVLAEAAGGDVPFSAR